LIRSKADCVIIWTRTIDLASQNNRLTSNGGHHRANRVAFAQGAVAFFAKPFDDAVFLEAVLRALPASD